MQKAYSTEQIKISTFIGSTHGCCLCTQRRTNSSLLSGWAVDAACRSVATRTFEVQQIDFPSVRSTFCAKLSTLFFFSLHLPFLHLPFALSNTLAKFVLLNKPLMSYSLKCLFSLSILSSRKFSSQSEPLTRPTQAFDSPKLAYC